MRAREQMVYVLRVKPDAIFYDCVENVHYEKVGFLDVTYELAKNLAKYYRSDIYESHYRGKQNDFHRPDDVLYPVEELLTEIEQIGQYGALLNCD